MEVKFQIRGPACIAHVVLTQ